MAYKKGAGFPCVDPSKTAREQRVWIRRTARQSLGLHLNLTDGQSFRIIYSIHLQGGSDFFASKEAPHNNVPQETP
jgi:hypothetical protein